MLLFCSGTTSPCLDYFVKETTNVSAILCSAKTALADRQPWHVHPALDIECLDEVLHKISAEATMQPFPFKVHIIILVIMNQRVVP